LARRRAAFFSGAKMAISSRDLGNCRLRKIWRLLCAGSGRFPLTGGLLVKNLEKHRLRKN
jgi:hypothetical protein